MGERTGDLHETAFLHLEEQHFVGAVMPVRTEADDRTTEAVAVALYALQRLEKAVGGHVLAGLLEHLDQHVGNALAVDGADIRVTAELRLVGIPPGRHGRIGGVWAEIERESRRERGCHYV